MTPRFFDEEDDLPWPIDMRDPATQELFMEAAFGTGDDIAAQDTTILPALSPTTREQQQVIDLLCGLGFTWDEALRLIDMQRMYAAGTYIS